MATGEEVSCDHEARWIPQLTIPDGSTVQGDSKSYLVKALEKEQRMRNVTVGTCSSLELVTYALPKIGEWRAPKIFSVHVLHAEVDRLRGVAETTLSRAGERRALEEANVVVVPSTAVAELLVRSNRSDCDGRDTV